MRTFKLHRFVDHSGISGTGDIAEGVEFTDGRCAIRFLTAHRSTATYDSMADLIAIHGHNGDTQVVYDSAHTVEWTHLQGRYHLEVNGYIVATEGDICRDIHFGKVWGGAEIKLVAALTNTRRFGEQNE